MRSGGPRRLLRRFAVVAAAAALSAALAACGGEGRQGSTSLDKIGDTEILNALLARELTQVDAYTHAAPRLHGRAAAEARLFLAHAQEHVDAITKAIRGLGGETTAEKVRIDYARRRAPRELLTLLYRLENTTAAQYLDATRNLTAPWLRQLAAESFAVESEHLVLLRQALGAAAPASVPEPFESGGARPPGAG